MADTELYFNDIQCLNNIQLPEVSDIREFCFVEYKYKKMLINPFFVQYGKETA